MDHPVESRSRTARRVARHEEPIASTLPTRAAFVVFGVLSVAAVALFVTLGRHWWFYLDEWNLLASRTSWSAGALLSPYNQHWTTLPILLWRAMWSVVGARSYLPYQAMSVGLHVIVAVLGRALMRRAGVRPWVATLASGTFLFFGAGAQNILSAFQIAFTGAVALGVHAVAPRRSRRHLGPP